MRRGFFSVSRAERNVLLGLFGFVVLIALYRLLQDGDVPEVTLTAGQRAEAEAFLRQVESVNPASPDVVAPAVRLHPFDPNRADSLVWIELGVSPRVVRNVLRYRRAGGRFRQVSDVARIYGMDTATYARLRPFINIGTIEKQVPGTVQRDAGRPVKLSAGEQVALNAADSAQLCRVPGIGAYRARAILRYGERLGGYVSVRQLTEIEGLPDSLLGWFTLHEVPVRRLDVNAASFKELLRHPYLSYEQVRVLVKHRDKYGPLRELRQLSLYPCFSETDLERLLPYLAF